MTVCSAHAVVLSAQLSIQHLKPEPHGTAVVQEQAGQQMLEQQARLDSLEWMLADARRLVSAVAAVEGHGPSKTALQVCSKSISLHHVQHLKHELKPWSPD